MVGGYLEHGGRPPTFSCNRFDCVLTGQLTRAEGDWATASLAMAHAHW